MKDKIQKLHTLLQAAIDIEAKSTEGEWEVNHLGEVENEEVMIAACEDAYNGASNDALFITNAKRLDRIKTLGLLELLKVVEWIWECGNYEDSCRAEGYLQSLLTIFAKELE